MREATLGLIHDKRESAKYHPQSAEGYFVLTGLKGKVVLCNLCETNEIFDRVRGFKWLCD